MEKPSTALHRPRDTRQHRLLAVLILLAMFATACSQDFVDSATEAAAVSNESGADAFAEAEAAGDDSGETAELFEETAMEDDEAMEDDSGEADGEALAPSDGSESEGSEPSPIPRPGLLTAGDIDDHLNFDFFTSILTDWQQENSFPRMPLDDRIVIDVVGDNEVGVGNISLTVSDGDNVANVVTNSAGRAHLFPAWMGLDAANRFTVTSEAGTFAISAGQQDVRFVADEADTTPPGSLDVALVLDVTGSMADELAFLTAEFDGIVARLDADYPNVDKRYALVVYRDEGPDEDFVTRTFDFTDDVGDLRSDLADQRADGGGDFPEAMDAALAQAQELSWSEGSDVARVLVLNADAPPHAADTERTLEIAGELGETGIRIYPLAASGVDRGAEFLMRAMALRTGGRHLFLTSDSGIGGARLEPRAQCYDVTGLDDLLYRVLASELAGERIEPAPEQILRTVGQIDRGVCA